MGVRWEISDLTIPFLIPMVSLTTDLLHLLFFPVCFPPIVSDWIRLSFQSLSPLDPFNSTSDWPLVSNLREGREKISENVMREVGITWELKMLDEKKIIRGRKSIKECMMTSGNSTNRVRERKNPCDYFGNPNKKSYTTRVSINYSHSLSMSEGFRHRKYQVLSAIFFFISFSIRKSNQSSFGWEIFNTSKYQRSKIVLTSLSLIQSSQFLSKRKIELLSSLVKCKFLLMPTLLWRCRRE